MANVDIKHLLAKLNPRTKQALHGAAELSLAAQHSEVALEHVFLSLLETAGGDFDEIFRYFEVDPSRVRGATTKALGEMRTGHAGKPVFSPILLAWLEEAYLIGGVDLAQPRIRSGALLLALVAKPGKSVMEDYTNEFEKIRPDELRRDFLEIVAGSQEDTPVADEDGAVDSARPGAAAAAAAGEEALARFTNDMTAAAREGRIDPILGRDSEIRQMTDILTRRRKNNPMIVGEAGVGKTAAVEGFALRVAAGDVPAPLRNVRVLELDLGLLQAGAGVKGEFENRLKSVITEVKEATIPTILFIDEAHTLIGAGGSAGTGDAANLLKPPLARGELRTIGATTYSEFKKYIEKDPALERRFQPISVDEPSVETCTVMMRGVKGKFEDHHNVKVLDRAVEAAVSLSKRYISGRLLPDKAVDVIDTACARVAMGQSAKPGVLDDAERSLGSLATAIHALESDAEEALDDRFEDLASLRADRDTLEVRRDELADQWGREVEAVGRIREFREKLRQSHEGEKVPEEGSDGGETAKPEDANATHSEATEGPEEGGDELPLDPGQLRQEIKKATEELTAMQGETPMVQVQVEPATIAQVIADWTGIPIGKMVKDEAEQILSLEDRLRERVVGQDDALAVLARKVRASKAGLQLPNQPIGVFLLVGPSGVGKTETGYAVADLLFGGDRFMTSINMSEFMEKHTVSRLIGSPPGYVGFGEGGVLTEAVRHRPYSVVLLDEIEKADPEVMNLFYQVFDKGTLSDGEGREVDFQNTILLMTSNLASDILMEACNADELPSSEELLERIRPALQAHLKPALLGRMTVLPYFPLSPEILQMIADMKLAKIGKLLNENHGMTFEVEPEARDALVDLCHDPESGARALDRVIDHNVMPRISQALLERMATGETAAGLTIGYDEAEGFQISFEAA